MGFQVSGDDQYFPLQRGRLDSSNKFNTWSVRASSQKEFFELGPLFALFQRDPGEVAE
jgi:hypothetical protein